MREFDVREPEEVNEGLVVASISSADTEVLVDSLLWSPRPDLTWDLGFLL